METNTNCDWGEAFRVERKLNYLPTYKYGTNRVSTKTNRAETIKRVYENPYSGRSNDIYRSQVYFIDPETASVLNFECFFLQHIAESVI